VSSCKTPNITDNKDFVNNMHLQYIIKSILYQRFPLQNTLVNDKVKNDMLQYKKNRQSSVENRRFFLSNSYKKDIFGKLVEGFEL